MCNFVLQGDNLEIVVLNFDGIRREYMELRKDWSIVVPDVVGVTALGEIWIRYSGRPFVESILTNRIPVKLLRLHDWT